MPNIRFLAVETDFGAGATLRQTIIDHNYGTLATVGNAGSAVRPLGEGTVDFLICNWNHELGPEVGLLKLIKSQDCFRHIPVLMTTRPSGNVQNDAEKVKRAAGAGVDGFLLKPYNRMILQRAIDDILSRYPHLA